MNKVEISDGRDLGAIIPAALDDYGLDPYEFRIYGRLARRCGAGGTAWESVSNMSIACGMGEQKAKQCLRLLCMVGLAERRSRPGHSSEYHLLPASRWSDPSGLKAARKEASYHPGAETTQVSKPPTTQVSKPPIKGYQEGLPGRTTKKKERKKQNEELFFNQEEMEDQEQLEPNPAPEVLTGKNSNQEFTSEEGEWNGHQEERCSAAAARTHNDNDFGITPMTPITPTEQSKIDRLEDMVFNGNPIATTELMDLGRTIAARDPFLSKAVREWQCFLRPRYFPIAQMVWAGPAPRDLTPEVMAGADAYRTLQLKRPATEGEVTTYLTNLIGGLSRMKTADEQQTAALALESRYQEGVALVARRAIATLAQQQSSPTGGDQHPETTYTQPSAEMRAKFSKAVRSQVS